MSYVNDRVETKKEETNRKIKATVILLALGVALIGVTMYYYIRLGTFYAARDRTMWYYVDLFFPQAYILWILYNYHKYISAEENESSADQVL